MGLVVCFLLISYSNMTWGDVSILKSNVVLTIAVKLGIKFQ